MTPMDLCASVSDECGHEEGADVHPTLLSGTLSPNGRTETDTSPGLCSLTKQMDLCACVSEECGDGGCVCVCVCSKS